MYCVHSMRVFDGGGIGFCRKPDTRRQASGGETRGNRRVADYT